MSRMKTYRFYLEASNYFLNAPNDSEPEEEVREYNNFASVSLSWMGLESYVNMISESLSSATKLNAHEKAFLNEKELRVNDKGIFQEINIRPSTTRKILFVIHHFTTVNVGDFKRLKMWEDLKKFEDLRNRIVHHKEKSGVTVSSAKAAACRDLTKQTIAYLDKKVFKKR